MRIRFVYLRPTPVLHYRAIGPYERSVKEAWGAILGWLDARDLRKFGPRAFGVIHDHARSTDPMALRYDACVELVPGLSAAPECGIVRKVTPGGAYAQGCLQGGYEQISDGFRYMCSQWAEAENLRIDTSRPLMEIYLNDPAKTPRDEWLTQLCVPIRTEPDPRKLLHVRDEELELDS
ncbi:MAG: GyrI-like domain-containing protein [Hyphomicrobium sp.]|nr:GyrI-like domain-containing protein [Hyphomicrobium sp.]MBN9264405.1 GyrI-like domain-containing protein [Hyphomicrobium sp.]